MLKQLFHINGGKAEESVQQVLSVRIGERHFSYAIANRTGTELYSLAYYTVDETTGEILAEIFSRHQELHNPFYGVQVSYDHPGSLLVPFQYHNANSARNLLDTMYGVTAQTSVISEAVSEWQLYNVYAVPSDVHDWISRKLPACKYRHNYTLGVSVMPASTADRLLIDFNSDDFSFIAVKQGKLLIAQTFSYTTPEDILYYLLKTCNQFSLSREEVQLMISGLIEKESQLFRELYQYFLHTDFREPVWRLPQSGENGYPPHFFTSLNDLARCES